MNHSAPASIRNLTFGTLKISTQQLSNAAAELPIIMKIIFVCFSCVVLFFSCKKDAGDGGNSTISGNIKKDIRVNLTNPLPLRATVPAADQDVYIIYGDHTSPDDRVQTNFDGNFEFLYLRPGKYTIYTFSKDTNSVAVNWDESHMTILREVEINDKKEDVIAEEMKIYDTE